MPAGFYESQLLLLGLVCAVGYLVDSRLGRAPARTSKLTPEERLESAESTSLDAAARGLTRRYLLVYAIVMGADWLQGPYVYSLYREQYGLPERTVALLFVTGFLSAGLAAPLVGVWADQYGRRRLCLYFCLTYTLACVLITLPTLPTLLLGRLLGGVATSILFSAFEAWLVSASSSLSLPASALSGIMGRATLANGLVATAAGVVSNELVGRTGSFVSPFVASGVLLCVGWVVIRATWSENYGQSLGSGAGTDVWQVRRLGAAWRIVKRDPVLLTLGLTQTCFEGSMYLFVFLWVPALQEARPASAPPLPLGYIFSAFMVCMMLGSLGYTITTKLSLSTSSSTSSTTSSSSTSTTAMSSNPTSTHSQSALLPPPPPPHHRQQQQKQDSDSQLLLHAKLSSLVCAASALALAASIAWRDEKRRFWAFCLFEACVGMYYPVQGMLRGVVIEDGHRATLSSLFRIPLNIFVVIALLTGVSSARAGVLTASALVLSFSAVMTGVVVVPRAERASSGGGSGSGQGGEGH